MDQTRAYTLRIRSTSNGSSPYLSCDGGVGFVEERPHLRLELLPPREISLVVRLLEAKFSRQFLFGGLLGVEVQPVEDRQRFLRVPMLQVRRGEGGGKRERERERCNNVLLFVPAKLFLECAFLCFALGQIKRA